MSPLTARRLMVGTTVSSGFDSNPSDIGQSPVSSFVTTVSPYLGLQAETATTQFLLQYEPTLTAYSSKDYSTRVMQSGSVAMMESLNQRWKFNVKASGEYGQDSARLLAPQQTVAVGGVPGTGPSSASYLPNAGTVTFVSADGGVQYQHSQRDAIDLHLSNTFSHYSGLTGNNSIATADLGYDRDLSPTLGLRAYGQTYHYYGAITCTSFGGGLGFKWHALDRTFLAFSGGPQLNSASCGRQQGFSFDTALSSRLTGKSQVYLLAARAPAVSYLGPGLWQTSISGGYQRRMLQRGTFSSDLGYTSSNTLVSSKAYSGTYFDVDYSHELPHGLSASCSYRGYLGQSGETTFNRQVALFSISWAPSAGHFFQ
jgi:hypothetical protein